MPSADRKIFYHSEYRAGFFAPSPPVHARFALLCDTPPMPGAGLVNQAHRSSTFNPVRILSICRGHALCRPALHGDPGRTRKPDNGSIRTCKRARTMRATVQSVYRLPAGLLLKCREQNARDRRKALIRSLFCQGSQRLSVRLPCRNHHAQSALVVHAE